MILDNIFYFYYFDLCDEGVLKVCCMSTTLDCSPSFLFVTMMAEVFVIMVALAAVLHQLKLF